MTIRFDDPDLHEVSRFAFKYDKRGIFHFPHVKKVIVKMRDGDYNYYLFEKILYTDGSDSGHWTYKGHYLTADEYITWLSDKLHYVCSHREIIPELKEWLLVNQI